VAIVDYNISHNEITYRILKNHGTPDTLRAIEIPPDFAVR
jgi:phospholipid N-methyltransferase